MLKKILHITILPCKTITYLIEKRISSSLTLREKIQLELHLIVCKWCAVYNKKVNAIHQILAKLHFDATNKIPDLQQSDLEKIKSEIRKKTEKN